MSLENNSNLTPATLYGEGDNGDVSMQVSPTGIILGGDLNTATPITATISQAGIITDNPTGFNILSSLNMNNQNITEVSSISNSLGDLNIASSNNGLNISAYDGLTISSFTSGVNIGTSGTEVSFINCPINMNSNNIINVDNISSINSLTINADNEINFITPDGIWISTTSPNIGDGDLYANFYGTLNGNSTTATSATNVAITDNNTSATYYPTFVSNNTGNLSLNVDKTTNPLSYIPSTGNLTSTLFTGLLSTGGLVYLSTGSAAITGSATFNNFNLTGIFNSTYKNYRIVLAPTTQLNFTAYPAYSLQAFLGTGTMPSLASLYGFEITSSATTIVSPIYTATATISSAPLILAVSQTINHQTIIEVENVGYATTTTQMVGLKCKSFYTNPGVGGASDRSILAIALSSSTISGLTLQQSSISVSNNMTIGWTVYGYK